jgi:hypothetical protein
MPLNQADGVAVCSLIREVKCEVYVSLFTDWLHGASKSLLCNGSHFVGHEMPQLLLILLLSITNKIQRYTIFFITVNACCYR